MEPRSRPSLDTISIPSACPKGWGELAGGERRRYCDTCCFHVTNLSALTRSEADAFLGSSSGRTCVTFLQRRDGSIVTREEAPRRRAFAPLPWLRVAAAALFALLPFLPGCKRVTPDEEPPVPDEIRTLGQVVRQDEPVRVLGEMVAVDPAAPPQDVAPAK